MITPFIEKALERAKYKILKDKTYFGEIADLQGVWATAKTLENCRADLREVLEDWLVLKLISGERISGLKVGALNRHLVAVAK